MICEMCDQQEVTEKQTLPMSYMEEMIRFLRNDKVGTEHRHILEIMEISKGIDVVSSTERSMEEKLLNGEKMGTWRGRNSVLSRSLWMLM